MDWDTLHAALQDACDRPGDEAAAARAVEAAEIVVSAAGTRWPDPATSTVDLGFPQTR